MPELKITVNCKSMLISTAFFRFCKGVEHGYYALLFTSGPYREAGAGPWLSWLEVGFHLAEREAPPEAAEHDRLSLDSRPGHNFEVTASSSNGAALRRLADLIHEVDRVRKNLGAADEKGRLASILADGRIEAMLLAPVRDALGRNAVPSEGVESYSKMMHRGLLAMCDPHITSIETTLR